MAVYSINYDLRAPGRDYKLLYEKIKGLGVWWHYLESTWLVKTNLSAQGIAEILHPAIDKNDNLLVIEVGNDHAGWLDKKAWEWIRIHTQAA